jgi:hypothetical protein
MKADKDLETGTGTKYAEKVNTNLPPYGLSSSELSDSWENIQVGLDADSTQAKMWREHNTSRDQFLRYAIPLTILYIILTLALVYDIEYANFLQHHGLWEIGHLVVLSVGLGLVWLGFLLTPRWQQARTRAKWLVWIASVVYLLAVHLLAVFGVATGLVKPEEDMETKRDGIKAALKWIADTAMANSTGTMGFGA